MAGLLLTGCGAASDTKNTAEAVSGKSAAVSSGAGTQEAAKQTGKKILVAYFSRTGDNYEVGIIEKGNTHIMADMIAEELGNADTFEIKTVKEYAKNYRECTEEAKAEKAEDARPELKEKVANFSDYDTVFLGYPIWWSDLPMPVYTFLESYDWSGKTVIPFCTSAGDAMTGLEERVIPTYAKGAQVKLPGLGLRGKNMQDAPESQRPKVQSWLKELGYQ
ncbi:MAG: NAD(P)H-dependent oxidoreductase [Selenomonadaceae bacterium]|nr:NAD(P)H-dependent oxidoreductase [Selenomonadaceae bacterium]